MSRVFTVLSFACALSVWTLPASAGSFGKDSLAKAEELYKYTDYAGSIALLNKDSEHASVRFLLGRDYFMLGDFKKAAEYLQGAVAVEPNSSEYMDWLGRAYGKRAEIANALLAPAYASKARQAFERSVQLDPKNSEALDDLFSFYLAAPGFLGGGYDKAAAIAEKLAAIDPPEGHAAKAELAQKRKEFAAAEQHLRDAVAVAPEQVGHRIALANFLANQGKIKQSDEVFLAAQQMDPASAKLWFARANAFIKQKRNTQEAKNLLERYVRAPITVDDPPREQAMELLKQLGGA